MSKTILIFSDGTGQLGGLRPDQRLSNVYKMYRAMRPGPESPISPHRQVAFYDAGLGAGETGGLTFKRIRNVMAAAVGTGIDENVIDCYAAVIANYEPGDRICIFGFSRGAYTARSLANVLNLCGVPTHDAVGRPVPRFGPELRAIASDGVRNVYNHGAGAKRARYESEREILADRFRDLYGSQGVGVDGERQGNVQPAFVGVFDTVAALGSRAATTVAAVGMLVLVALTVLVARHLPWWVAVAVATLPLSAGYWFVRSFWSQVKFFADDATLRLSRWNPRRQWFELTHSHVAWWSGRNYDRYADKEVGFLRHAQAIDEDRARFPRVGWARSVDLKWHEDRGRKDWLLQFWFAGNHSDIGGSYPEEESRLSDIALRWMVDELNKALGDHVTVLDERLVTSPDPLGLQHSERTGMLNAQPALFRRLTFGKVVWGRAVREISAEADLHPSVLERLAAPHVPQMGEVKKYRPESLRTHRDAAAFYGDDGGGAEPGLKG
ncbi:phospholipase effector Tle1 domain-containing protein [Sphingomonas sp. TX0522]|jgi:hypothetical protein|uniref:phospholipase effector Tle1 domain-containing protein n=1 Tax=Sphingomonas sp. TX0522 TaxID=2479205 RepID=UPI001E2FB525|nr:DUF2235 domain-containing protein [Sphingomonas sp. TX0522]MBI0532012.1 DUF2235 domain-containing protein [Sphingomonas sp. TX0522]